MRVKQPQFYRLNGIREKAQFTRPRLIPLKRLELPLETIYHYLPADTVSVGPNPQDPLLEVLGARLFVEHVVELGHKDGNPRRTVLSPLMLQNDYRRKTRGIRPLRKDEALLINPRSVLVVNYAMLQPLYRYIPSYKATFFRWSNITKTFWDKVVEVHQRFQWNQYIELQLPDTIPTLAHFKRFETGISQKTLELFPTPQHLSLTDLWYWLGDDRNRSNMAVLPPEAFEKINFLVTIKGYFFVFNLGLLDEWRKDKDVDGDTGLDGSQMQRRFLRLLNSLHSLRVGLTQLEEEQLVETPEVDAVGDTAPTQEKTIQTLPETAEVEEAPEAAPVGVAFPDFNDTPPPLAKQPTADGQVVIPPPPSDADEIRYPVPAEVEHEEEEAVLDEPTGDPMTKAIVDKAFELHQAGMISAKAYDRLREEAERYKSLPDPYGSGASMEQMLTITPEDLTLELTPLVKDRTSIVDKSMLTASVASLQRQYTEKVMRKDILNAVMSIQTQGIMVRDYRVEEVRDAMDHYEEHIVTVKPVRGRQTTLRFRLPVVDKDGRFISSGNIQRMRIQRADVPIRKVSPSRVALTSYYNKTFVDRSGRKINNFELWLGNLISNRGLDPEDTSITDVRFANHFNAEREVPRIHAILSKRFGGFTAGDYKFDFNPAQELFNEAGQVLIAHKGEHPVYVDGNNTFYLYNGGDGEVLGTVFDVLGIDPREAPLEVAEMSVSNKVLPVGFVMAYQHGLSKLIEMLGCEVARYRRGERNTTQADEYSLVFQDEVLVFSRLDQRALLVLAGMNRFHQTLKKHSVWDFDRRDVYYRLLEEIGLGVRFLREIESLYAGWVDPITKGLLEEMGEPTDFRGLLLRSVELLLTDYSPSEVDGAFMRYRGYERFAGAVYGELQRAAKTFNARVSTGETGVELNPHAVWMRIVQDPSVALIEESNPIQDLREQEVMTYRGEGGRSGKSMVERTRVYHDNDVGVVSESTVDSGDVGVVAYLSPDANFINLRGITRRFDKERDGAAKLLSTSALMAPGADKDDQGMFCIGMKLTHSCFG